ncbi:MAG: hypothetical protein ACHBN1_06360 [Heteroscytonema crispum UTEX LB 1556]
MIISFSDTLVVPCGCKGEAFTLRFIVQNARSQGANAWPLLDMQLIHRFQLDKATQNWALPYGHAVPCPYAPPNPAPPNS